MTKITIWERCSGKTTRLIIRSATEGSYILVSNKCRVREIVYKARDMNLHIPEPITIYEYFRGSKFRGSAIREKGILIDELDDVIREIFSGFHINEVTINDGGNISFLRSFLKEPKESEED